MSFIFTSEMMKIENTIKIVSFLLKKQIDKHDRMRIVLFCFKNSGKLGGLVMSTRVVITTRQPGIMTSDCNRKLSRVFSAPAFCM